jgi:hypothetical protein
LNFHARRYNKTNSSYPNLYFDISIYSFAKNNVIIVQIYTILKAIVSNSRSGSSFEK